MSNPQTAASIQQAFGLYSAGQHSRAETILTRLLASHPADADAVHLLALVRSAQGRHPEAEELFRRSLSIRPAQPEVLVNLGNTLRDLDRGDDAIAAFREAIRLRRDFLNAHLSLGHALHAANDLDGAERAYRNALRLVPRTVPALQGLGSVLNDAGRAKEAEEANRRALSLAPPESRAALEHNLGTSLKLQDRFTEALERYDAARRLAPGLTIVESSRAAVQQELGRLDEAIESYRRMLKANPADASAHRDLNRLLYRMGRDEEFLASYRDATKPALLLDHAFFLKRLQRGADARGVLERAVVLDPESPKVLEAWGSVLADCGEPAKAILAFERALALDPGSRSLPLNLATAQLCLGDAAAALANAREAMRRAPLDQSAIAAMGLAERALGDSHEEALNDYETFVQVFDLEAPRGYADMESFNRDLDQFLNRFHTDTREHFDQTLRGGTQSLGKMFGAGHDLVEQLRSRIDEAVAAYIARMKNDAAHPLLGRRSKDFAYAGSWSSRLNDCGFHTNHLHPKGWISSCYYIALPDAVADTEGKQGWIKFGEPNFEMGLRHPVRRVVQPQSGRLVLFPSYMWHGTVPFHSTQSRTTIAFDVVPR